MRKLLLATSIGYSLTLLILCLVNISDVVQMSSGNDKVYHAIAYFVFTVLWFFTVTLLLSKKVKHPFTTVFSGALIFGTIVEILQHTTTQNRQGDYKDIIANITGTLVALIVIKFIIKKER